MSKYTDLQSNLCEMFPEATIAFYTDGAQRQFVLSNLNSYSESQLTTLIDDALNDCTWELVDYEDRSATIGVI